MKMPTFVSTRLWLDFCGEHYEDSYGQLIADLWGESVRPRPKRGPNPFRRHPVTATAVEFDIPDTFSNPAACSTVTFNPSLNNGRFWVGEREMHLN